MSRPEPGRRTMAGAATEARRRIGQEERRTGKTGQSTATAPSTGAIARFTATQTYDGGWDTHTVFTLEGGSQFARVNADGDPEIFAAGHYLSTLNAHCDGAAATAWFAEVARLSGNVDGFPIKDSGVTDGVTVDLSAFGLLVVTGGLVVARCDLSYNVDGDPAATAVVVLSIARFTPA